MVKKCKPVCDKKTWGSEHPITVLDKFYLFTSEFKKWKNVVYLDADIIVKSSLDELSKVKGFAAVQDGFYRANLMRQFINKDKSLLNELKGKYNVKETSFNTGVMAFNTDIIRADTFTELLGLLELFSGIVRFAEQPILNLFFYKKWTELPIVYNLITDNFIDNLFINKENMKAIILHFNYKKPWLKGNHYHNEWKSNLEEVDLINLKKSNAPNKKWSNLEVHACSLYWRFLFFSNMCLGLSGVYLKNISPRAYHILKKWGKKFPHGEHDSRY